MYFKTLFNSVDTRVLLQGAAWRIKISTICRNHIAVCGGISMPTSGRICACRQLKMLQDLWPAVLVNFLIDVLQVVPERLPVVVGLEILRCFTDAGDVSSERAPSIINYSIPQRMFATIE